MTQVKPLQQKTAARRAVVRRKSQLTLPPEVRAALHVNDGDEVEFTVQPNGEVFLRGMAVVPADQRWFWTQEWQAGEREATAQISVGDIITYEDPADMFAALRQQ